MTQGYVDGEKAVWSIVGCTVLLLTVRVMDDVKDYEKDKVVHPDRPLPRGLIRYDEVRTVIWLSQLSMVVYGFLIGVRFGWLPGLFFFLQVFYTHLMYIEFGIGDWLEERPFLYAITHQLSIFIMAMFIGELGGASWKSGAAFLMGCIALSGFFTYEVCRKLDPTLPKIKGTYLIVCGKWPTFFFTVGTVSIGVASSFAAGFHWLLWPLEGLMITSLLVLFLLPAKEPKPKGWKPKAHKPVEGLAIIYVLVHMWAPFIASFV